MGNTNRHKFSESEKKAIVKALEDPEKRRKVIEILEAAGTLPITYGEAVR